MKKYLAILLAALMELTLFACGSAPGKKNETDPTDAPSDVSEPTPAPDPTAAPVDAGAALKAAYEKMLLLKSEHMNMVCDVLIVMSIPAYSTEQNMDIGYDLSMDIQSDPDIVKMEGTLNSMGNSVNYLYYGVQDGDDMQTYVSYDNGATWTSESSDVSGLADQANSMNSWILEAESAEFVGTETDAGVEASMYTCEIPGSAFAESNDMLSSLGGGIDASLLEDIKPVPATIWIDNETGLILRISVDMAEYMRTILERGMQAQMAEAGVDIAIEFDVKHATLNIMMSQFDSIAPIVIPEEAKRIAAAPTASGDGLVGTWELSDGEGEEAQQSVQMLLAFGMTMEFTFNADGTGSMSTSYADETSTEEFTYTIEGNEIVIEGEGAPYRIEGDLLYLTIDEETLIFKRK